MKRYRFLAGCIIFVCGVMWSNLTFALPHIVRYADLIPVPVVPDCYDMPACYGTPEYCIYAGGQLLVLVKNQGLRNAPSSTTKVEYSDGVVVLLTTPHIPVGGIVVLTTPVRWNSSFTITVDSSNKVNEWVETNNSADGNCFCIYRLI